MLGYRYTLANGIHLFAVKMLYLNLEGTLKCLDELLQWEHLLLSSVSGSMLRKE